VTHVEGLEGFSGASGVAANLAVDAIVPLSLSRPAVHVRAWSPMRQKVDHFRTAGL
jgi:hypothetical protein